MSIWRAGAQWWDGLRVVGAAGFQEQASRKAHWQCMVYAFVFQTWIHSRCWKMLPNICCWWERAFVESGPCGGDQMKILPRPKDESRKDEPFSPQMKSEARSLLNYEKTGWNGFTLELGVKNSGQGLLVPSGEIALEKEKVCFSHGKAEKRPYLSISFER